MLKKRYMIKRELTLDNVRTHEFNSYWVNNDVGWGPASMGMRLSKIMAQHVLNIRHSGRWYTKREHAHLHPVEGGSAFVSTATSRHE